MENKLKFSINQIITYIKFKYPIFLIFFQKFFLIFFFILIVIFIFSLFLIGFQNLFSNVIASFLYSIFILLIFISALTFKLITYRKPLGVSSNDFVLSIKNNYSYYIDLTNLKIDEIVVDIEHIEKIKQLEDFTYVNNFLKFLPFEKKELFILEAGALDIPKLSLDFISISNENHLILKTSSCSYFSIYYTHYFADYNFSTVSNMENIKEEKTLREVLGNILSNILDQKIIHFINNRNLSLIPLLPNPLGVTGIINIEDKYIIRKRKKRVISELDTYDWSFSGLIDSHDFLLEYYLGNKKIKILKIIEKEILDELDLYKKLIDLKNYVYEIYPLGIIFNAKYLYQPELILFIRLKKEIIENFNLKSKDIKFYTIDEIKTIIIDGYKIGNKKIKNLFIISFELLYKFLNCRN